MYYHDQMKDAFSREMAFLKLSAIAGRHKPQEKSGDELRVPAGAAAARVFAKAAERWYCRCRWREARRVIDCGGAAEAPERREGLSQKRHRHHTARLERRRHSALGCGRGGERRVQLRAGHS